MNDYPLFVAEMLSIIKTEDEIIKIFERADTNEITETFLLALDENTARFLEEVRQGMFESVMIFRAEESEFLARLEQSWHSAFVSSEILYIIILDATKEYAVHMQNLPRRIRRSIEKRYTAMLHLHGRAMQIYKEIITLMKNGFADGAYARWRSLYELVLVACFIIGQGEQVASEYIKAMDDENQYEWARASGLFGNKKNIRFGDLCKHLDFNVAGWNNQYSLASAIIHPSSDGTFKRIGNYGAESIIPVGRTDYGLTTPGEHSAMSLCQITGMFFSLIENPKYMYPNGVLYAHSFDSILDLIREQYFKAHDCLFPDDEPMWTEELEQKNYKK